MRKDIATRRREAVTGLWILLAGINGFLAVALNAYGTHGLADVLTAEGVANFDLAAQYQLVHGVGLLAVAWLASRSSFFGNAAGALFVAGIVLFSGSLYVQEITGSGAFSQVTPFGGGAFMLGWIIIALSGLRVGKNIN